MKAVLTRMDGLFDWLGLRRLHHFFKFFLQIARAPSYVWWAAYSGWAWWLYTCPRSFHSSWQPARPRQNSRRWSGYGPAGWRPDGARECCSSTGPGTSARSMSLCDIPVEWESGKEFSMTRKWQKTINLIKKICSINQSIDRARKDRRCDRKKTINQSIDNKNPIFNAG